MTPHGLEQRFRDILAYSRTVLADLDESPEQWSEEIDEHLTLADKVLVETALLLLISTRAPNIGRAIGGEHLAVAQALRAAIPCDRYRTLIRRFPRIATSFGLIALALRESGAPLPALQDEAFAALLGSAIERTERVPFRLLELYWMRELLGSPHPQKVAAAAFSSVAQVPHPFHSLELDAYALTHAVMFITDFGRRCDAPVGPRLAPVALDHWLAWCLASSNLDILGEILVSAHVLYGPDATPTQRACRTYLFTVWGELGFLPAPSFRTSAFAEVPQDQQHTYVLKHTYHTMYVAGILGFLVGGATKAPSTRGAEGETASRESMETVRRLAAAFAGEFTEFPPSVHSSNGGMRFEAVIPPEDWRRLSQIAAYSATMPDFEPTVFIGDVALCAAVRAHDVARLLELLQAWVDCGLQTTPLFVDAVAYAAEQLMGVDPISGPGFEEGRVLVAASEVPLASRATVVRAARWAVG